MSTEHKKWTNASCLDDIQILLFQASRQVDDIRDAIPPSELEVGDRLGDGRVKYPWRPGQALMGMQMVVRYLQLEIDERLGAPELVATAISRPRDAELVATAIRTGSPPHSVQEISSSSSEQEDLLHLRCGTR